MKKFKLKKGDNIIVISGKDKGKTGEIIEVLKSIDKVKVRGVNIVKKHKNQHKRIQEKLMKLSFQFTFLMLPFLILKILNLLELNTRLIKTKKLDWQFIWFESLI